MTAFAKSAIVLLVALLGLMGGGGVACAQTTFEVLDWQGELTWNTHLIQKMHRQYDERARRFRQATRSEASAEAYRQRIQENYQDLLGRFPPLSPLSAERRGTIERDGYRIEKVLYESFPDHHVTANLYVPSGDGPFPGVLFFCGHEREAKATPSYQRTAMLLAKHGFVVLIIDPISQGERFQLTSEDGEPLTRGGTTAHTLLGASANLVGTDVVNYEYWDNKRGLDYLLTRPEVDTTKIGVLGNSGGATMGTYFMGLNEEVDVAALSSYVTKRQRSLEVLGPQDGCQWLPYEGRAGLEIVDFLLMNTPTATLTLAGRYDFVDHVGTRRAQQEMDDFYSAIGQSQETRLFTWQDGHGLSKPKREEVVQWFRHWFYGDTGEVEEGDVEVLPEQQLQVTPAGQVNASFDEYNIQERNLDLAEDLGAERKAFRERQGREAFTQKIEDLLNIDTRDRGPVQAEFVGTADVAGGPYRKVILRREGQVPLPALVRAADRAAAADVPKTVVWLSDQGKRHVAAERRAQLDAYAEAGVGVLIADVRGTGETEDPAEYNPEKYYDRDYRNDQLSLHVGVPAVGQRVQDVLTTLDFVAASEALPAGRIEMRASGRVAPAALHAAAFDSRIDHLILSDTIDSYMDILRNPLGKDWYAYVVPNALKFYDLPDLAALAGDGTVEYTNLRTLEE